MDDVLKGAIYSLLNQVQEVIDNGDWPIENEQAVESLMLEVREGIAYL